jgi:uncharacterized membrane protein
MSEEKTTGTEGQSEGVAGVGMFVGAFVDERTADAALERMKQAKRSGEFYYDDAAIVRCDAEGKLHIKETGDMSSGKGAGVGALVGGVIGILGGPAGVAIGAGAGAALGAIAAHHDAGFSNESLKEIGSALVPGSSAIAATTSERFIEEVRKQAQEGETLSVAHNIAADIRENLELRQDVLYSMLITEEGVAARKVISSPTMLAVFGVAATEGAVAAGGAVATAEGVAYEVAVANEEGVAAEVGVATAEGAAIVDAYAPAEGEAPEGEQAEEEE